MPLITHAKPVVQDMLECQMKWHLSDTDFGHCILGDVQDAGKTVRGWKSGSSTPTPPAVQSFRFLKTLVAICNNSPLCDAEENYGLAHGILPGCLK